MRIIENLTSGNGILWFFLMGAIGLCLWWLKFQKQLNITFKTAVFLSLMHFILAFVAIKIWPFLEVIGTGKEPANMRLYGALFMLPPLYYVWAKRTGRNVLLVMDVATVCMIVSLLVGRLNCLKNGCCTGMPMFFMPGVRWPLVEIELVRCVIMVVYYIRMILKNKSNGMAMPTEFITYGLMRFAMEWVREEYTGQVGAFHLAHIWSLIAIAAGAVMLYKVRKQIQPGGDCRNDAKSKNLAKGGK